MSRIYVGTYAKYNNGSIEGAWLDLSDYSDKSEFEAACIDLHKDESDPEFMFQDFEDIPRAFISECSLKSEFWDYQEYEDYKDGEAKSAYVYLFGEWNESDYEYRFYGKYASDEALGYEYVESTGMLGGVPENIKCYFDYASFGHDLAYDFSEDNHYYFHNQ